MRVLAFIGALAICAVIAGGIYFFGGFYNVSAATGGNPAVEWSARAVREASVGQHAQASKPPPWFNDAKTVTAGAHEFAEEGCVDCHGAPGRKPDKFAKGMDPNPPDLGKAVAHDPPGHVFWVIKNGIRMTGMPAFGGHMKDEEIWRAVAFAQHMAGVTPEQYQRWSAQVEADAKAGKPAK
jgi:cytochrome c553